MPALAFPLVGPLGGGFPSAADPWAQDIIEVRFEDLMKNDAVLQSPNSYQIFTLTNGAPVTVTQVLTGNGAVTRRIFLVITPHTPGAKYQIIFGALNNVWGVASAPVPCLFFGRTTKIDSILKSRPAMYDMRPTSTLRTLLNAIGREDDRIGGSRNDQIVPDINLFPVTNEPGPAPPLVPPTWLPKNPTDLTSTFVFHTIWGFTDNNIWAAGGDPIAGSGLIEHWNGTVWTVNSTYNDLATVRAIWGFSPAAIYVGGDGHNLKVTTDGGATFTFLQFFGQTVNAIWGTSDSDLWVATNAFVQHSTDGGSSFPSSFGMPNIVRSMFGFGASDIYAVGDSGLVSHYDGVSWTAIPDPSGTGANFTSVWGPATGDVYVVGDNGHIYHTTNGGSTWTDDTLSGVSGLTTFPTVFGSDANHVYVGAFGSGLTAGRAALRTTADTFGEMITPAQPANYDSTHVWVNASTGFAMAVETGTSAFSYPM